MAKIDDDSFNAGGVNFYVEAENDEWSIWWEDFMIVGGGATREAAIADARQILRKVLDEFPTQDSERQE